MRKFTESKYILRNLAFDIVDWDVAERVFRIHIISTRSGILNMSMSFVVLIRCCTTIFLCDFKKEWLILIPTNFISSYPFIYAIWELNLGSELVVGIIQYRI